MRALNKKQLNTYASANVYTCTVGTTFCTLLYANIVNQAL